jgi:uncharacterized protein
MSCKIFSINYCPVKSLSFQSVGSCEVKKDLGILNDRVFAFSRIINFKKAKLIERYPNIRNLNNFLTLKNSPSLNKYNFDYKDKKLTLTLGNKNLISISVDDENEKFLLSKKIIELESSLIKPITLLYNSEFPFYDTSGSKKIFNSVSLINKESVKDFEKKINKKVEIERFRGNFYIEGIKAWEENNWVGKIIKINDIFFRVEKKIPRCVAINLKPNTEDNKLDLFKSLKQIYNNFDMGIYLKALDDGKINVGDSIIYS